MKITIQIPDDVIEEELDMSAGLQALQEMVYETIVGDPVSRLLHKKLSIVSMLEEADAEDHDVQSSKSLYNRQIAIARSARVSFG